MTTTTTPQQHQQQLDQHLSSLQAVQQAVDAQLGQLESTVNDVLRALPPPPTTIATTLQNDDNEEEASFAQFMDDLVAESRLAVSCVDGNKRAKFAPVLQAHRDSLRQMLA